MRHEKRHAEESPHHRHDPARRAPVAVGHAHADGRHPQDRRGDRRRRLLLARMLGRRHVRRLHALPAREPVGTPAPDQGRLQEDAPADAPARAEPARLQALPGRHRGPFRGARVRERDGHFPRVRRAERPAQPREGHCEREEVRRPRAGHDLLHHFARPHRRELREAREGAGGDGHRLPRHQGHGRHPHARSRARARGRAREGPAGDSDPGALPHDERHGRRDVPRGRGGGRRLRGLRRSRSTRT